MDKLTKKDLLKKFKKETKENLKSSLPIPVETFKALFDHLDMKLNEQECDDTLAITIEYLETENLPLDSTVEWLKNNGGFCDCEVLANIEEKINEII